MVARYARNIKSNEREIKHKFNQRERERERERDTGTQASWHSQIDTLPRNVTQL